MNGAYALTESAVLDIIRNRVGVHITRFDASYIEVALTLDGVTFATDQCSTPSYEIREGGD